MSLKLDSYELPPMTASKDLYYNFYDQTSLSDGMPLMETPLSPKQSSKLRKQTTFLFRLFEVLEDPQYQPYIFWLSCNTAIGFYSSEDFKLQILEGVFNGVSELSFIRQLNMYGFAKMDRASKQSVRNEFTLQSYKNPYFLRGRADLLQEINRKVPSKNTLKSLQSIVASGNDPGALTLLQGGSDLEKQVSELHGKIAKLESKLQMCHQTYVSQKLMIEKMMTYIPVEPKSPPYGDYGTPPRHSLASPPHTMINSNSIFYPQTINPNMLMNYDFMN